MSEIKIDPLYTIFEKHLYDMHEEGEPVNLSEKDSSAFVEKIVTEYLRFLTTQKVAVPLQWKHQIADELRDQVRQMLVKKVYGCLSVQEFVQKHGDDLRSKRKLVQKKYRKLF